MSNAEHLDDVTMVKMVGRMPFFCRRVHLHPCGYCGEPLAIAGVLPRYRRLLPYSPNKGPWRAFELRHQGLGEGWRSSKRYGFVPNAREDAIGFAPHDCPKADWRQEEVS
jgi:hypothetical protein